MGFPLNLPLSLVRRHPLVVSATRCQTAREKLDTRQVSVELRGPLPPSIDLGSWGLYYLRPYAPEPLRCFRCQRYGHHQHSCERPLRCGMCSGNHASEICLAKYKAGQKIAHRCPNCDQPHHSWNPACPARAQRVDQGRRRQGEWVQQQQDLSTAPAPPGTFVWGQQPRSAPTNSRHSSPAAASVVSPSETSVSPPRVLPTEPVENHVAQPLPPVTEQTPMLREDFPGLQPPPRGRYSKPLRSGRKSYQPVSPVSSPPKKTVATQTPAQEIVVTFTRDALQDFAARLALGMSSYCNAMGAVLDS